MGFKKGHILRFNRKLKSYNESHEGKNDDHDNNPPPYNPKMTYDDDHKEAIAQKQNVSKSELLGGDGWIELGEFRLGDVDGTHFSISHRVNRKTCMIFRKDGTIHPGPRTDYGLWDKKYVQGMSYTSCVYTDLCAFS